MSDNTMWAECFDLGGLSPERRVQVTQTLNWLEQHFPEFNSMMYDIRQGLANEHLTKVELTQAMTEDMGFDHATGELDIDFKPKFYLGLDGKIYETSLNELLVHELEHVVQHFKPLHALSSKEVSTINGKYQDAYLDLADYLERNGVYKPSEQGFYMDAITTGNWQYIPKPIPHTDEFKRLSQNFLDSFNAIDEPTMARENAAIDRANILSVLLGKPGRGNHWDTNLLNDALPALSDTLLMYTDAPEDIRKQSPRSWYPPKGITLNPQITGRASVRDGTLTDMQREWNDKWNKDTKNLTAEEWREIEQVKAILLTKQALLDMSPETKAGIEALADSMKRDFNLTPENDRLSPATQQGLKQQGQAELASKASIKGWSL